MTKTIIFLSGCSVLYVHFKRKHIMLFEQDIFCNSLLGLPGGGGQVFSVIADFLSLQILLKR